MDGLQQNESYDDEFPSLFKLTKSQQERIERNKLKAKALKHAKLVSHHPYKVDVKQNLNNRKSTSSNVALDSKGGYIVDLEEPKVAKYKLVDDEDPPLPGEEVVCIHCGRKFGVSFLKSNYQVSVCDVCRGNDKYKLIAKTEAKQTYCLKDCDFEERCGPPLPFIIRRNPHHPYGGSMKLYLVLQVEERAAAVWNGREGLDGERERRAEVKEKGKQRKYEKKIKELRSSIKIGEKKSFSEAHEHSFPKDSEVYDEETDLWTKICSECGYQVNFEKM